MAEERYTPEMQYFWGFFLFPGTRSGSMEKYELRYAAQIPIWEEVLIALFRLFKIDGV